MKILKNTVSSCPSLQKIYEVGILPSAESSSEESKEVSNNGCVSQEVLLKTSSRIDHVLSGSEMYDELFRSESKRLENLDTSAVHHCC